MTSRTRNARTRTAAARKASSRGARARRSPPRAAAARARGSRTTTTRTARSAPRNGRRAAPRARATPTRRTRGRSQAALPLALALLARDHRNVAALFRQFENGNGRASRQDLARTVCKELRVHAQLEEELFYPALAQAPNSKSMLGEAVVEHSVVKGLVARIERMTPDDDWYADMVKVLQELIEHHVEEEEREIFARARRAGVDLNDLGLWMLQRKIQLRAEHGLPEEESIKLDVQQAARLRQLEEEGWATRFVGKLTEFAQRIAS